MVIGQPLTRRLRQQGGLIRLPGAKGLGLLDDPFSHSDPLQPLLSWQIYGRLWSACCGFIYDRRLDQRNGRSAVSCGLHRLASRREVGWLKAQPLRHIGVGGPQPGAGAPPDRYQTAPDSQSRWSQCQATDYH